MCVLCHDFKGNHTPYIGLQLPSTVASSSNTPILYGIQTTTAIPTETALPCCLLLEKDITKGYVFQQEYNMYPPFTTNHYLADFLVVTLHSASCKHAVISGSVVLFTHCTLDAITHVIIALEQSARYIYIHYII